MTNGIANLLMEIIVLALANSIYLQGLTSRLPGQPGAGQGLPCCFRLALSQMAGLIATLFPEGNKHLKIFLL